MVEFKSKKEIITCSQKNPTKSECDIIRRYEGMGVIFKEKVEGGGGRGGGNTWNINIFNAINCECRRCVATLKGVGGGGRGLTFFEI